MSKKKTEPTKKVSVKKLNLSKFKFNFTIKSKLYVSFISILLIPLLVLGLVSYTTAKTDMEELIITNTKKEIENVNRELNALIDASISDLNYLSKAVSGSMVSGWESPALRQIIDPIKAVKNEYDHVQFATKDGMLLNSPQQTFAEGFDVRERGWYKDAMANKGQVLINNPIIAQDGKVIVVPSKAAEDGSGVVSVVLSLTQLATDVNAIKIGENGYVTILDSTGKYLTHPVHEIGSEVQESYVTQLTDEAHQVIDFTAASGEQKKAITIKNEHTGWTIVGDIDISEIKAASRGTLVAMIIVLLVAVVVSTVIVIAIIRSIAIPLRKLVTVTDSIAEGDLTNKIAFKSKDEIGMLSNSINKMSDNLRHIISQVSDNSERVAMTSQQLSISSEETQNTSEHISRAVQEIAIGGEKQVNSANDFTNAIADISQGMDQAATSIHHVSELASTMNHKATQGNAVVEQTVKQMNLINESVSSTAVIINELGTRTNEISSIVKLISDIASQTNLLALNAAIEAARAGEHGRGFAVVADEVRKLAVQSASAAGDITKLINQVQEKSESAVQSMAEGKLVVEDGINMVSLSGTTFNDLVHAIERVTSETIEVTTVVNQVNASSQEMVALAENIANIAEQAASNTQNVAAATEEQSASMAETAASAEALSKMAADLQQSIRKFKM